MDLTLGISPCPNDVWIFSGIIRGAVKMVGHTVDVAFHDVETLNRMAQKGQFDVVKISYANFAHCGGRYDLLNCGGALGRGVGPLLLVNGSGSFDPAREVMVPGRYTTANLLLDFYLQRPATKRFLAFDALYEELLKTPGAQGVVIHEKRFTYERDGLSLVQDLGEHWETRTGHAIPLGAIALRKTVPLRAQVETLIRRSLAWAEANRADALALCREHAQDLSDEVIRAHIALYVNEYTRDLGKEGSAAVEFFLAQQRELSRQTA